MIGDGDYGEIGGMKIGRGKSYTVAQFSECEEW
jgi:hypothetical protein